MSIAELPQRVISPDDLLHMPDEGRGFELVAGELREINVSNESSRIAGRICTRLDNFCEARGLGWIFPEGNSYQCFPDDPSRVRRADTAFIALSRMTPQEYRKGGHCPVAPDVVVEVVSPNDLVDEVEEKLKDWLSAGVKLVWIINPPTETIRVHRLDGGYAFLQISDTLSGDPVLPGFACPVADLFRLPAEPAPPDPV
jgi:Uma2 family endonuclease